MSRWPAVCIGKAELGSQRRLSGEDTPVRASGSWISVG